MHNNNDIVTAINYMLSSFDAAESRLIKFSKTVECLAEAIYTKKDHNQTRVRAAVFRPRIKSTGRILRIKNYQRSGNDFVLYHDDTLEPTDLNSDYVVECDTADGSVCYGWRNWYWYKYWSRTTPTSHFAYSGLVSFYLRRLLCRLALKFGFKLHGWAGE